MTASIEEIKTQTRRLIGQQDGRCGSCRHWTPPGERTSFYTPVERSYRMGLSDKDAQREQEEADKRLGECNRIECYPAADKLPEPAVALVDASQYFAQLFPAEDFGCVLWQSKEEG